MAGVILNLAVWLALHVLFETVERMQAWPFSLPLPDISTFDPRALLLALLAALLIVVLKRGVPLTLVLGSVAGLLLKHP